MQPLTFPIVRLVLLHLSRAVPPSVMWAQRNNVIFLTICLEDCKNPEIKIANDKVYFHGVGGTEKKNHEVTIPLFKEIDPEVFIHEIKINVKLHTAFQKATVCINLENVLFLNGLQS
jgi:hypothetical protein